MKYEPIIGLEIHVQLNTKSKMFCSCSNEGENKPPNTTVCEICLGHPGTLPVPNKQALNFAIKAGLALNGEIAKKTKFDRKNYFYPDLPKGYQISQFDQPVVSGGYIALILDKKTEKHFKLTRAHLEEDAAKNTHTNSGTLIDFNRGGTPLLEIVTEPDFRNSKEAKLFLQELRTIMRYLKISNADMEKGQMRCDANISLRPKGQDKTMYPKTEIKNLNSFKAVEKALEYEIKRQTDLWNANDYPKIASTRGWDEKKQETVDQRKKEASDDYRYFPEPDIPHITITQDMIDEAKATLPELPLEKRRRFYQQYGINLDTINQILPDLKLANYIEDVISELKNWLHALEPKKDLDKLWEDNKEKLVKLTTGWLLNKLPPALEKKQCTFDNMNINPENFAEFLSLVHKGAINSSAAQTILEHMIGPDVDQDPSHIMNDLGLAQIDNKAEVEEIVEQVIAQNPDQAEQYRAGKEEILKYLIGQTMKMSKGKANPKVAEKMLIKMLS